MSEKTITLYPSNWLYNAGVVGLINSLEVVEQMDVSNYITNSGEVNFILPFFKDLNSTDRYFSENKISSLIGNNQLYKNYLQHTEKDTFTLFIKKLDKAEKNGSCHICNNGYYLTQSDQEEINSFDPAKAKFLNRIKSFNMVQNSELGPSEGEFPNGFWNMKQSVKVCHLCNFVLIHYHLALTKLSDNTEIFVNAPSFKLMYELNKLVKETFGNTDKEEARNKREILAMSVIEYVTKVKSTLGLWTAMNIEIVTKSREGIDFYSVPSDVIKIISDRRIASILSELGEFKILNKVLDRNFSELTEIGYLLLKESTKDVKKRNDILIKGLLYRWDNQRNLTLTANKILKLYSLIEEKIKRSKEYEHAN